MMQIKLLSQLQLTMVKKISPQALAKPNSHYLIRIFCSPTCSFIRPLFEIKTYKVTFIRSEISLKQINRQYVCNIWKINNLKRVS